MTLPNVPLYPFLNTVDDVGGSMHNPNSSNDSDNEMETTFSTFLPEAWTATAHPLRNSSYGFSRLDVAELPSSPLNEGTGVSNNKTGGDNR